MQDKICLITGASAGIGKMTALELAKTGATLILVSRNEKRGQAVLEEIRKKTGNLKVVWMQADLSSQADIRRLVDQFKAEYAQLHLLINNAGIVATERKLSVDGLEMTFAVNHLSYFLLTNLLLEQLVASEPARIVNVASQAHSQQVDFNNLQGESYFEGIAPYYQSKCANIMFTVALARRLAGTKVTANCLHPGVIDTQLLTHFNEVAFPDEYKKQSLIRSVKRLIRPEGLSPTEGAKAVLYLALSPEVESISGRYFENNRLAKMPAAAEDETATERLWAVSAELVL